MYSIDDVAKTDKDIADLIEAELARQNSHIELIASENWVSKAVMAAMGSPLTNKYAEGYSGKRYYGGCECVDVVENAIQLAGFFRDVFKISDGFNAQCVSVDWIEKSQEAAFDGIFCCNVIDVVPEEAALNIIKNMARITTDDAAVVIGMNYYIEPVSCPEKNLEVRNKNELYVDGVLRMVSKTDDEWKKIFEEYFNVDSIEYFAWPGEKEEKRRVFCLSRK